MEARASCYCLLAAEPSRARFTGPWMLSNRTSISASVSSRSISHPRPNRFASSSHAAASLL